MPAREPNSTSNPNSHNLSNTSSKNHNSPDQNDWVTMTETIISEEADIKCTSVSKETKPTSPPARDVSAKNVENPKPKNKASDEASRHSRPAIGFPRYPPGAVEITPHSSSRNKREHDTNLDMNMNMNMNINTDTKKYPHDDEHHYTCTYTYTTNPSLAHSPPPSHIPRTPHSLHTRDLESIFPNLEKRTEHFANYFQNMGIFEADRDISPEPKFESKFESKSQILDTSDADDSEHDAQPNEMNKNQQQQHHQQTSTPKNAGIKTTKSPIHIHANESFQRTSPHSQIPDVDEDEEYERDLHLDLYPASDFETSSVSSSSASSEDRVDG
ncbi:hypothetical protein EAE96_011099 [Botrytis aclada]|nr:hypothetical protein EAE96_011099 [Botrytis aclada]